MMGRLLCWLGLHWYDWTEYKGIGMVSVGCRRCGKGKRL